VTVLEYEGILAGARGDKARHEEFLNRAIEELPVESPRHPIMVLQRANLLCVLGRLEEVERDFSKILAVERWRKRFACGIALIRFIGLIETGRLEEARRQIRIFETDTDLMAFHAGDLRMYTALLQAMERPEQEPPTDGTKLMRQLALGRPDPALAMAREQAAANVEPFLSQGHCGSFNLIRAELASGNPAGAQRLLDMRRSRGNRHYLDDLFFARIERLFGNLDAAARHFASAMAAVDRYRAQGRLDWELRLACELKPGDLARLAWSAGGARPTAPARPASVPEIVRGTPRLIGPSPAMEQVRQAIRKMASADAPVLITGETGTGKELAARALHEESPRKDRPFVAVNCGAIAESLLEAELFGHERGAFTGALKSRRGVFEEAEDGTLFLDEIGDISPRLQVALLRVLETGEIRPVGAERARPVACRVVAATNADLQGLVERGQFRKDLLYRLKRLEIRLPALRERSEDILPLAQHLLDRGRRGGEHATLSPELKLALLHRSWPGNVRELQSEMERMRLINSDRLSYGMEHFNPATRISTPPAQEPSREPSTEEFLRSGKSPLRRLERLRALFQQHRRLTRSEVAALLRVSPETATHDLKMLCSEGTIVRVEPTRSRRSHYFEITSA
jgi:DNA-binding NtrC family response regulator